MDIKLSEAEVTYLKELVGGHLKNLRERQNPPKGWTYGKAQDAMNCAEGILEVLG